MFALNNLRWPWRIPIKLAVFGLIVLVVCFPSPGRLIRHVGHWWDPNALVEPEAPALQPLWEELQSSLPAGLSRKEILEKVERFVYAKIEYEWDWNTWGTADYLPTVTEAIAKGREDCDGRAVVAASLLRRFGFNVELVTDFAHVWVKTEAGETMGPSGRKAVIATEDGLTIRRGALAQLPRAIAYGIAPFPLIRELIILVAMWLMLVRRGGGVICNGVALLLFVMGLLLLRRAGQVYHQPVFWMQMLGVVTVLAGFCCLLIWAQRNARGAACAAR